MLKVVRICECLKSSLNTNITHSFISNERNESLVISVMCNESLVMNH